VHGKTGKTSKPFESFAFAHTILTSAESEF
jgi:hypothetical protein